MDFEGFAGGAASIIPIIVIVILVFWLLVRIVRVVPQYDRLVILALGKYSATRGPGLVFVIPILERAIKVDLRERFLDIPAQTAITRDNAPISIDFLVYYRVIDPRLSVLEVDNVVSASLNIATTTLRAVIGDITLDDVLSKREQINDTLRVKLDDVTERWGLKITSVEIREIEPPRAVQEAMNRQMSAERERRAEVLRADGEREAAISVAEGEKRAAILRAEGAKESALLEAQGAKQAQLLKAQGYARALSAIHQQASKVEANTMALQYLETLREIGASESTKFVLPMELTAIAQQLSSTLQGRFANDHANESHSTSE